MTQGSSRELLELWAPDSRNGLIITGYSIEGTMARVSAYCSLRRAAGRVACLVLYVKQEKEQTKASDLLPQTPSTPALSSFCA
jgi:Cft2 family RNA processing exonuclease